MLLTLAALALGQATPDETTIIGKWQFARYYDPLTDGTSVRATLKAVGGGTMVVTCPKVGNPIGAAFIIPVNPAFVEERRALTYRVDGGRWVKSDAFFFFHNADLRGSAPSAALARAIAKGSKLVVRLRAGNDPVNVTFDLEGASVVIPRLLKECRGSAEG